MSQKHELGFMDSSNIERISKALANETRLLIFEVIARNKEMTSSTIVTLRRVAAATVSHHLKILSHAGLIECRRHGQFVHNRVVPRTIEVYARALCRLSRAQKQSRAVEGERAPKP
jgi:DNA-binding transcriptional ArsR family regulator